MQKYDDFELLKKAAVMSEASELSTDELNRLAELLDMDKMFTNFPEELLHSYRDRYSGQLMQGMRTNRNKKGKVTSYSFIPHAEASRLELYEGLIFFFINPAVRNLATLMVWFCPSDYARMSIRDAAGWSYLSDSLSKVKEWSKFFDVVRDPGELIKPILKTDTSNLVTLDNLIFNSLAKSDLLSNFYLEDFSFV